MSRQKQAPEENAKDLFRREVRVRQGYCDLMSQNQLSASSGIPQSTLSKRLAEPDNFTVAELRKLIETLSPDPLAVLRLVGYSTKDVAKLRKAAES